MDRTLSELLQGYNQTYLAQELTRRGVRVSRGTVNAWALGKQTPDVRVLPCLAEILRVDVGELTTIVARGVAV